MDFYALQKISQILAEIFAIAKISANFCAYICGNIYIAKNAAKFCTKNSGKIIKCKKYRKLCGEIYAKKRKNVNLLIQLHIQPPQCLGQKKL